MGDLFHELVPDSFIVKVFDVIARCPEHTFQLLTKRPARMAEFVSRYNPEDLAPSPLPNLWLGASVENQAAAQARLPELLRCRAAVLFASLEPLIAPVDLTTVETPDGYWLDALTGILREPPSPPLGGSPEERRLGWVIVGGESGPGYRPMSHEWVRALRGQCVTAEVPFFFKQSSGVRHNTGTLLEGENWRQFPEP